MPVEIVLFDPVQSTLTRVPQAPTTDQRSAAQSGRCRVCATRIVVSGAGEVVVKNAILRVDRASGLVTAKCPRCKAWVEVPLRYIG